jgi:hypothetical protein
MRLLNDIGSNKKHEKSILLVNYKVMLGHSVIVNETFILMDYKKSMERDI